MLIKWRQYTKAKKGTIQLQALYRGYGQRKKVAAVKTQKYYRRYIARKRFTMLMSAAISLQCRTREKIAKKFLFELKKEQKDVGKLKQNNEKLKQEMASLRAMLSAQAKEGAASDKHKKELKEKEEKITELENRIADIEKELKAAKALVDKLEAEAKVQAEQSAKDREKIKSLQARRGSGVIHTRSNSSFDGVPDSPGGRRRKNISGDSGAGMAIPPGLPDDYVSPEVLAEHRAKVAILEEELEAERRFRRDADGEIIKLRAKINGVELNDADVRELLAQKLDTPSGIPLSVSSSFSEEPSRLRYIFLALIVLLLLLMFCSVPLLCRRSSLRIALQMNSGVEDKLGETMDNKNLTLGGDAFEYEELAEPSVVHFHTSTEF